ncbi:60S ribosomal protein L7 [Malassezia nana]|uniref:60S ribosomal protein L7 n=1 Tax=Malassezia nana TaxID=180528 RepID=A0AAF0J2B9_9BASI|nr:60S ribosomal protein L7 [Malassezia nana]
MSAAATVKTSVPSANDVLVPETLLKKRKADAKLREEKQAKALELRKMRKQKRQVIFKRAEQYVQEYKAAEREQIRLRRLAKSQGDFFVPAQPRVAFVVRIRGVCNIPPKPRKIMQLLRLLQINNGVFIKLTNATQQMLQLIAPYVAWGEPNLKTIRELIYKRGFAKVNRQRIPITDNMIIEQQLGKYGIISVEDLVHEIATAGPNFKAASQFLWPFQLSNPTGGFRARKLKHFVEGGDAGDRESDINRLVRRMN